LNIQLLTLKIVQTLSQEGILAALRKCLSQFKPSRSADDFDLRYSTDTGGIEPLWKFKIGSPNACFGSRYEVTQEKELSDSVNFLKEGLQNFTFIDLGCGKGRTFLVASKLA